MSSQIFRTHKTITFREADPAGIMFFGNIFAFAHDAFEEFIIEAGYSWKEWFQTADLMIPIRHTAGDFLAPFLPGETYDIAVTVASFGETSFKMKYIFSKGPKTHASVVMVHSVLDSKTKAKAKIPAAMKSRLEKYLNPEESQ
jgi:acyl-CoA thioesterase FadM